MPGSRDKPSLKTSNPITKPSNQGNPPITGLVGAGSLYRYFLSYHHRFFKSDHRKGRIPARGIPVSHRKGLPASRWHRNQPEAGNTLPASRWPKNQPEAGKPCQPEAGIPGTGNCITALFGLNSPCFSLPFCCPSSNIVYHISSPHKVLSPFVQVREI